MTATSPQLVFIGEAWGEHEELLNTPFVGPSGQELYRMIGQAGLHDKTLPAYSISPLMMRNKWKTFPYPRLNVFNLRPPDNEVLYFYTKNKGEAANIELTALKAKAGLFYLKAEYADHVRQLHEELQKYKPNLIVPLGATACWALGLGSEIRKLRGFVRQTPWGKALPTWHPAAILRHWPSRGTAVLDLIKAAREMQFPEIRVPERYILTEPSVEDLWAWWDAHGKTSPLLALDIETANGQISEISFASDANNAIHIPFFWKDSGRYKQYWPNSATEEEAWKFVKHVCECTTPKLVQNGIQFDCYWLAKVMNIVVRNVKEDTMVKAHCWQPEFEKSLSFLGSVFLDEMSWKGIRKDTMKDDS